MKMLKYASLFLLVFVSIKGASQTLINFEFNGNAGIGTCPTQNNANTTNLINATVTSFSRTSDLSCYASDLNNNMGSSGWTTATAVNYNQYLEVTVTASAGYQLNLYGANFNISRMSAGPVYGRIANNANGDFSNSYYDFTIPTSSTPVNWTFTSFSTGFGGSVKFRIYGWNATSGTNVMKLWKFSLIGTVTPLAIATTSTLGLVKVGNGLSVDNSGLLTQPAATTTTSGGIKLGNGVTVDASGAIKLPTASSSMLGAVKVGTGTGLSIDNSTGILSVNTTSLSSSFLPISGGGTVTGNGSAPALTINSGSDDVSGLQFTKLKATDTEKRTLAVDRNGMVVFGADPGGPFLPLTGGNLSGNLGVGTSTLISGTNAQMGTILQVGQNEGYGKPTSAAVFIGQYNNLGNPNPQIIGNWASDQFWGIGPANNQFTKPTGDCLCPNDKILKIGRVDNTNLSWKKDNGSDDGQLVLSIDGQLRVNNTKAPNPVNSSQLELFYNQDNKTSSIQSTTWGDANATVPTYNSLSLNNYVNVIGNQGLAIGTTSLHNYQLAVNGTIGAKKVKVTAGPWPDYVFSKTYKLPSLQSVEQYIAQNNHLPDVPSAATVAKEGIDLGDNQAVLLKKIEELTLYVIKLQKEVDELKKK